MKTKEQVQNYLMTTGVRPHEVSKIMGFLIGANIKDQDEIVPYKIGDGTFEKFYEWFQNEEPEAQCPLCGLIEYLFDELEIVEDEEKAGRLCEYLTFLFNSFDIEVVETEDSYEVTCSCEKCSE